MTGDPWPRRAYQMRTPFIATLALCSGLGKSGVGGKCFHCYPWAEDARVMASSKMRKRRQNHTGCFDIGLSRTVPSQLTDLELSVLRLPRKYTLVQFILAFCVFAHLWKRSRANGSGGFERLDVVIHAEEVCRIV